MNGEWGRSTTKWIASTLQMFSCTVPPLNCGHSSASFLRGITTGEHRIECCVMLRFFHFILSVSVTQRPPINPPLIETNVRLGRGRRHASLEKSFHIFLENKRYLKLENFPKISQISAQFSNFSYVSFEFVENFIILFLFKSTSKII